MLDCMCSFGRRFDHTLFLAAIYHKLERKAKQNESQNQLSGEGGGGEPINKVFPVE